jgi:hypothetical protein
MADDAASGIIASARTAGREFFALERGTTDSEVRATINLLDFGIGLAATCHERRIVPSHRGPRKV